MVTAVTGRNDDEWCIGEGQVKRHRLLKQQKKILSCTAK